MDATAAAAVLVEITQAAALRYSGVAATILLLWDICITIEDEVEFMRAYVRKVSSRAWLAVLYLFNRYFALATQISLMYPRFVLAGPTTPLSPSACYSWLAWTEIGLPLIVSHVQLVLVLRVRALYHKSRWIPTLLSMSYCAELVVLAFVSAYLIPRQDGWPNCWPTGGIARKIFSLQIMPCFALDTVLFALTFHRVLADKRQGNQTPLLQLVLRDGAWAYLLMSALMLLNITLVNTLKGEVAWIGVDWTMSFASIVSSRLLLNMQRLGRMQAAQPDLLSSGIELSHLPTRASQTVDWERDWFPKYDDLTASSTDTQHMAITRPTHTRESS